MKFYVLLVCVIMLLSQVPNAASVTCNPLNLASCAPAMTSSAAPTRTCCSKLKEQVPCFCSYLKNPALKGYISSPNGRRVARSCGVPYPNC